MNKKKLLIIVIVLAVAGAGLAFGPLRAKQTAAKSDQPVTTAPSTASQTSSNASINYIELADYQKAKSNYANDKVVLFFKASWCPTCQSLDRSINSSLSAIPGGTVIVKVDYDTSADLKKQYGVTYQHTLVQIDKNGGQIKKWSGSPNLNALLNEVQVN